MDGYQMGADWASGQDLPDFICIEMQVVRELRVAIPDNYAIDFWGFKDEVVKPGIATSAVFHHASRGLTVEIDSGQNFMTDTELLRAFLPIVVRHLSKIED